MSVVRSTRTGYPPMPTLSELVKLFNLRARKKLSQNFLLDMNICKKLVSTAGYLNKMHVCEVGPGPGGLTRSILDHKPKALTVIEKDPRFITGLEMLKKQVDFTQFDVIRDDVLDFDFESLWPEDSRKLRVAWDDPPPKIAIIGNLPFNIATPLIIRWYNAMSERRGPFAFGRSRLLLTFQLEVAQRMLAVPETPFRCRLSFMTQYLTDPKLCFAIPGTAFVPSPKVDVGVVSFVPKVEPLTNIPFKVVEQFVRNFFHYRQKHSTFGIKVQYPKHLQFLAEEVLEAGDLPREYPCFAWSNEHIVKAIQVFYTHCHQHPGLFYYDHRKNRTFEECQNLENPLPPPIIKYKDYY